MLTIFSNHPHQTFNIYFIISKSGLILQNLLLDIVVTDVNYCRLSREVYGRVEISLNANADGHQNSRMFPCWLIVF